MSTLRAVKHFVVTWENGRLLVSRAREIVPKQTYQIIQDPKPFAQCSWNFGPELQIPLQAKLVETPKKKSSDF